MFTDVIYQKLIRWFVNHSKVTSTARVVVRPAPSKPRATNAAALFANERKEEIRMEIQERRMADGLTPKEANLPLYHQIVAERFKAVDPTTRAEYEAQAAAHNATLKNPPPREEIFKFVTPHPI